MWSSLDCLEPHAYICKFRAYELPPGADVASPPPGYRYSAPAGFSAMQFTLGTHTYDFFTERKVT